MSTRPTDRDRFLRFVLMPLASLLLCIAFAEGGATVSVAEDPDFGSYLVDSDGRTLYMFANDEDGTSTCYESCAENWPPYVVERADFSTDGEADVSLLGTEQREDGSWQVTYADLPLYTFVGDEEAGDIQGHEVGDVWFLVAPSGEPIGHEGAGDDDEEFAHLFEEGEALFASTCSPCHGGEGQGGAGPRLDGRQQLSRPLSIIGPILWGFPPAMPVFGEQLTDREVAAIATYVRNAWSNDFGPITEDEVASRRR